MLNKPFLSHSLQDTSTWAKEYSKTLTPKKKIGLIAPLGSGKTTLIQEILKALNYHQKVTSPSYSLINEYESTPSIVHMDLYRLDENSDWDEIGLDYYFSSSHICFIEWAERLHKTNYLLDEIIKITVNPNQSREITLKNDQ